MVFKVRPLYVIVGVLAMFAVGYWLGTLRSGAKPALFTEWANTENFDGGGPVCTSCNRNPCGCKRPCKMCGRDRPCGCGGNIGSNTSQDDTSPDGLPYASRERCPPCPSCPKPDMSQWIRKSQVPPCPPLPDMTRYMLKTECPPLPDMSKYVLKSSVPKCPPCISTCSKPCKIGECPPCPRPRCPVVKCPDPKACPACPAAQCAPCPEPAIQCKANYNSNVPVRPMLASTSAYGLGM
jgi:hypothetical protein